MRKKRTEQLKRRALAFSLSLLMALGSHATSLAAEAQPGELQEEAAFDAVTDADAPSINPAVQDISELLERKLSGGSSRNRFTAFIDSVSDGNIGSVSDGDIGSVSGGDIGSVSAGDYTAVRYQNRVTVKNNAKKGTEEENRKNALYAILVETAAWNAAKPDEKGTSANLDYKYPLLGTQILPEETVSLYSVAKPDDYSVAMLDQETDYTLLFTRALRFTNEEGKEEISDYGVMGYSPEYDENYDPKKDASGRYPVIQTYAPLAEETEMVKKASIQKESFSVRAANIADENGAVFRMSVAVQKDLSVKFTLQPDKKDQTQKTYKKFKLYTVEPDAGQPEGFSKKLLKDMGGAKAYKMKSGEAFENGVLKASSYYLVECADKNGNVLATYATLLAPYFLNMQGGFAEKEFQFTFTNGLGSEELFYRLELGGKKKEYDAAKASNGFGAPGQSLEYNATEFVSPEKYPVTKKISVEAISADYHQDSPAIEVGTNYFGRVKAVGLLGGLKLESGPSNVLACKGSPELCMTLGMAGVRYDATDAKKNNNANNLRRAQKAFADLVGQTTDDGEAGTGGNADADFASNFFTYLHEDHGTDAKSGMVFFVGVKNSSDVKEYQLMRSDNPQGPFKKLKSYKPNDKALLSVDQENNVYAVHYNSFPTEKKGYYTVRVISKRGNAAGGCLWPMENTTEIGKAQIVAAIYDGQSSVNVMWIHDDSAKFYEVYRAEKKNGTASEFTLLKTVGANASKKKIPYNEEGFEYQINSYVDKNGNNNPLEAGKTYYYRVRPVFDKNRRDAYASKESDMVDVEIDATFTTVKSLTATNVALRQIQLGFVDLVNINKYRIYRLETKKAYAKIENIPAANKVDISFGVDACTDGNGQIITNPDGTNATDEDLKKWSDTQWNAYFSSHGWTLVDCPDTALSDKKPIKVMDNDAGVGRYYFYLIQTVMDVDGADRNSSSGVFFTYSGRVRNVPLAPTNLKADKRGNNQGANVTWGINAKDRDYKDRMIPGIRWSGANGNADWQFMGAGRTSYGDGSKMGTGTRKYEVAWFYPLTSAEAAGVENTVTIRGQAYVQGAIASVNFENQGTISVSTTSVEIKVGNSATVDVSSSNGNGINYSVGNSGVASVSRDGNRFTIKGVAVGETSVTFTADGCKSRSVSVKVVE